MNRIVYGIMAAVGVAAAAVFVIFLLGPSFNRLYGQDNSLATGNASKQVILISINNITVTKLNENTTNFRVAFDAHNTGAYTAILQTIDYTAYIGNEKIAFGGIGQNSIDVVRGQEDFNIIGNGTVTLKDQQTIKRSDVSGSVWNELVGADPAFTIKGLYTYRDNTDLQAAGGENDFVLTYPP